MFRYYILVLCLLLQSVVKAQVTKDSLFLELSDERLYVRHMLREGETVFTVAELYNVPAVVLAQNNGLSFYESLKGKTRLLVPLGSYNFRSDKAWPGAPYRPLYYKRQHPNDHQLLPVYLGITDEALAAWNQNPGSAVLMAGWVEYHVAAGEKTTVIATTPANTHATPVPVTTTATTRPQAQDTIPPSDHELMYNYQTDDGTMLDSLSGSVVFFQSQTKVSDELYAFCNDVTKGRVVKIVNPSTGKFVFARVLGPMPATKLYHNALIGVDSRAQKRLGVRDMKLWCKIYYK